MGKKVQKFHKKSKKLQKILKMPKNINRQLFKVEKSVASSQKSGDNIAKL